MKNRFLVILFVLWTSSVILSTGVMAAEMGFSAAVTAQHSGRGDFYLLSYRSCFLMAKRGTNITVKTGCRLLIIAGLSPQVVTEALYLLTVRENRAVKEIKIFTTPEGKKVAESVLLLQAENPLMDLCRSYGLNQNDIRFKSDDIIPVWQEGAIDEESLQAAAANQMMKCLSKWTADGEPPLAVCVAGGRKNMGILFVQVFALLARQEDRIFHLVVSSEFQHLPEFFFPPPAPTVINTYKKGGGMAFLNTKDAFLVNVEIPVIRLRPLTNNTIRKGLIDFAGSHQKVQRVLENTDTRLYLFPDRLEIKYHQMVIKLPPREFALYHVLCRIKKEEIAPFHEKGISTAELDNPALLELLESAYQQVKPNRKLEPVYWIPKNDHGEISYTELKEKIVHGISKIKQKFGNGHSARIYSRKERGSTYYFLELDSDDIILEKT